MLYLIGIGLWDEKDISIKALEAIKRSKKVYLENYTSKLSCSQKKLERLYKKKIILANRDLVESSTNNILDEAKKSNVAFLVIGDIFSATTHIDLFLQAKKLKIKTEIIHNASVITAVSDTGLEIYKFGKTTSIPFNNENIKTPIEVFKANQSNNMHTLFLLDLDPENNKFMTAQEAASYLIKNGIDENEKAVACGALGSPSPEIKYDKLKNIKIKKLPQCLIIPAKNLHFKEEEALALWK